MKNTKLISKILVLISCVSLVPLCNIANAQTADRASTNALEEILVTARKREESIQDVPIAVTALSGDLLESGNILNLKEIAKFSPNVELIAQPFAGGALSASIRGLSFDDLEKSFEPTVGVSIDGIFLGTSAGANVDLFDVESVEVLRGPQGTLFGRNTIGGGINIRRTKPTGEFGIKAQVGLGRYEQQDIKAVINVPVIEDILAAKFSVRSLEGNTFQFNVTRNEDVKGRDLTSGSATFLFTPAEDFDALLTLDFYDDNSRPPEPVNLSNSTELFCALTAPLGCAESSGDLSAQQDYTLSFAPIPFISTIDGYNVGLEINKDFGDLTLTSVSGYQDFDELLDEENTGSPIELFRAVRNGTYEQFSQELRLTSNWGGDLNFVAGFYYFNSNYTLDQTSTAFGASVANDFFSEQDLDAYALFGELTYQLTDTLRLTAGGRFTDESKKFDHVSDIQAGGPFTFNGDESWSEFTHRLSLDYNWSDGKMAYVNWSTGFRSGGWNGRPASLPEVGPFEPETVDNYEIGVRTDWLDSKLRINLTGFYTTLDDKQEQFVIAAGSGSTATVVENAAEATYQGIELEAFAAPFEAHDLNFRFSVGVLDAEYDSYIIEGVDVADSAELILAPDLTVGAGMDYSHAIGAGGITYQLNYKWTDDSRGRSGITPDPFGRDIIDSYGALDISANYRLPLSGNDTVLTLSVYGTDVLQEGARIARPFVATGAFSWGSPEARRLFGVKLGVEY